MAAYRIRFLLEVRDAVRRLPPEVKRDVKVGLRRLSENPLAGKPLAGDLAGFWAYRARRYRILYEVVGREVRVHHVGHRQSAYQRVLRKGSAE